MTALRRRQPLSALVRPPSVTGARPALRDPRSAEEIRAADREAQREHDVRMAEHDAWMAQYRQDYARDRADFRAWLEQYEAETERVRAENARGRAEYQRDQRELELHRERRQREYDALAATR